MCKVIVVPVGMLQDVQRCSTPTERVINVWNSLPCDINNFSSVKAFKKFSTCDRSLWLLHWLFLVCVCVVIYFFSLGILYFRAVLSTIMLVSLSCLMLVSLIV